ncbi:MAG: lycopene cyclase family protein [Deltaproteobacteria bacterium]|nr:lycopene cyclase family protein [Deltaproteobacteria bacterium]
MGSGPAALAVASACVRRGASVTLVAPEPHSTWLPNYCLWADEVPLEIQDLTEQLWPQVSVATVLGGQTLDRPYVKLDTEALQAQFWETLQVGSVRVVPRCAVRLDHQPTSTTIHSDDGAEHQVRVVIDASGSRTPFVRRVHSRRPAFQTAYGLLLDARGHGFDPARAVLMDFRPASNGALEPPSFSYVLPLSDGRLFIEETSLASRPSMSMDVLRERLEARLKSLGLARSKRLGQEHCSIAMGLGLPAPVQSLVPFGAAAGMVHPASGYLLSHVLRKAVPVADSILNGLDTSRVDAALAAGNAALWPRVHRRVWEIYGFGLETLVGMNASETNQFFNSFFRLPPDDWSDFLRGNITPSRLGAVMTNLFRDLPHSVRWHLVRTGFLAGVAPLARSVLQPSMR